MILILIAEINPTALLNIIKRKRDDGYLIKGLPKGLNRLRGNHRKFFNIGELNVLNKIK